MKWSTLARYALGYGIAAALGVSAGWVASSLANGPDQRPPTAQGTGFAVNPGALRLQGSFMLRGHITGLVPGKGKRLRVHVTNPNTWRIRLLTLTVVADNATSGCQAKPNLSIGSYDARRPHARRHVVPSRATAVVSLPIKLKNAFRRDQDQCKSVVFPMRYFGTAYALVPPPTPDGPP